MEVIRWTYAESDWLFRGLDTFAGFLIRTIYRLFSYLFLQIHSYCEPLLYHYVIFLVGYVYYVDVNRFLILCLQ